jgi:hypothetical protein
MHTAGHGLVNSLSFHCIASTKQHTKIKASFNIITKTTAIIFFHAAQNTLTANDRHNMAMVITVN